MNMMSKKEVGFADLLKNGQKKEAKEIFDSLPSELESVARPYLPELDKPQ